MSGNNPIIEAHGLNAFPLLFQNNVRIERKSKLTFTLVGIKKDKDILLSSISTIQFKKARLLLNGYIQFSFFGDAEIKAGILNAARNENAVVFNSKQQPAFEAIKVAIEKRKSSAVTSFNALEEMAGLRDKGIITSDEFAAKKNKS